MTTIKMHKGIILGILLTLAIGFFVLTPFLKFGTDGVFFSIDPDVVYVSNALSNIKYSVIGFYDHPGIPASSLLTLFLLPFRFYAKFISHENFFQFFVNNYSYEFVYLRVLQDLVFSLGIFILFLSTLKIAGR